MEFIMNKCKVGAVIVTYNPTAHTLKLIKEMVRSVDLVVVVDNGSKENIISEVMDLGNLQYIQNKSNMGLARALNIGCEFLQKESCKYVLLLDQDSWMKKYSVKILIKTIVDREVALVGPQILIKLGNKLKKSSYLVETKEFFKKVYLKDNEIVEVLVNITSGSVINLQTWDKIGRFWDELFIEGIDNEYCLRLNSKGYKVLIDSRAKLYQQCGEIKHIQKYGINWYPSNHSSHRYMYMYRNQILILRRYARVQKKYTIYICLAFLKKLITIMVAEDNRKAKLTAIGKGCIAGIFKKIN